LRRKFEKHPSHTIVSEAEAANSWPAFVLYSTPLILPFSSTRDVTVPCSSLTLHKDQRNLRKKNLHIMK